MAARQASLKAGGTIRPSRFITLSGVHTASESNANDDAIVGITSEATRTASTPDITDANHALVGEPIEYFAWGEECLIELGTGGCTAGNFLEPDADGKGIVAAQGDTAGALALETGAAGNKVRVLVMQPFVLP